MRVPLAKDPQARVDQYNGCGWSLYWSSHSQRKTPLAFCPLPGECRRMSGIRLYSDNYHRVYFNPPAFPKIVVYFTVAVGRRIWLITRDGSVIILHGYGFLL